MSSGSDSEDNAHLCSQGTDTPQIDNGLANRQLLILGCYGAERVKHRVLGKNKGEVQIQSWGKV